MVVSAWQTRLVPGNRNTDYCYFWTNAAPPGEALYNDPVFPTIGPYSLACPALLHSLDTAYTYDTDPVQFGQGYGIDAAYHRGLRVKPNTPPGLYDVLLIDANSNSQKLELDAPLEVLYPGHPPVGRFIQDRTFTRKDMIGGGGTLRPWTTRPGDRYDRCLFKGCAVGIGPGVMFTDCVFEDHNEVGHATQSGHMQQSGMVWCRWIRTGRGMVLQPSVGECSRNLFAYIVCEGIYSTPNGNEGWCVEATDAGLPADDNLLIHLRYVNSFGPAVILFSGGKKLLCRRNKLIDGLLVNGDVVLSADGAGSDVVRNTFQQFHHDGGCVRVSGNCRLNDWWFPASTGFKPGAARNQAGNELNGKIEPYYSKTIFEATGPDAATNWLDHPHCHAVPAGVTKYTGFAVRNEEG